MDMAGKVVMVTGATNGIGKQTALALARMGATVIVVGRSRARCDATIATLSAETGNNALEAMVADLSSMAEVRRLAAEFKAKHARLHVLINNAGAIFMRRETTADGYERTFAFNHLSYFLLTNLLLDVLKASAPARVVNVSSEAQQAGRIDWENLQGAKRYTGFGAYALSKLANVMFTYELARRLEGTGVTANVLHPGFVRSGFGHNNGALMRLAMRLVQVFALSPEQGAQTSVYLASAPEVEGITGKYWIRCKPARSSPASLDEADWARLWQISERLTALEAAGI